MGYLVKFCNKSRFLGESKKSALLLVVQDLLYSADVPPYPHNRPTLLLLRVFDQVLIQDNLAFRVQDNDCATSIIIRPSALASLHDFTGLVSATYILDETSDIARTAITVIIQPVEVRLMVVADRLFSKNAFTALDLLIA